MFVEDWNLIHLYHVVFLLGTDHQEDNCAFCLKSVRHPFSRSLSSSS